MAESQPFGVTSSVDFNLSNDVAEVGEDFMMQKVVWAEKCFCLNSIVIFWPNQW